MAASVSAISFANCAHSCDIRISNLMHSIASACAAYSLRFCATVDPAAAWTSKLPSLSRFVAGLSDSAAEPLAA